MARIQVYLRPTTGNPVFRFIRPGGHRDSIPALRLQVFVDLLAHIQPGQQDTSGAFPFCALDSGSHLSVVPERIWGQFRPGVVTPLPFDPAMPLAQRVFSFGGGTWPYELGELTVRLRDLTGSVMDVTLVAQLTNDSGRLTVPLVLGLRGGVLDGRILRSELDSTVPFGQTWFLEDP